MSSNSSALEEHLLRMFLSHTKIKKIMLSSDYTWAHRIVLRLYGDLIK